MAAKKTPEFEINPSRLLFLLDLYKMSESFFIHLLNNGRKKPLLNAEDVKKILKKEKKVSRTVLKKIDNIFHKGLTWIISNQAIPEKKSSSIFFRKDKFNTELDFASKKFINTYEELKNEISLLSGYVKFNPKKAIKNYTVKQDPKKVAQELSEKFTAIEQDLIEKGVIKKPANERDCLKNLIRTIEELNIYVFEFVETWNKKDRARFDGFFISPNVIVIKRQQKYLRREILTLMHEFSHYLLNEEEIDKMKDGEAAESLSKTEQWCYSFAFYFLLNKNEQAFNSMIKASKNNNFFEKEVGELYEKTLLSTSAIYTRMKIENKINSNDFSEVMGRIRENIKEAERRAKLARESLKEQGITPEGRAPVPIESTLFKELVTVNYFEGNINESSLREYLNIKPEKSLEEVIY